MYYDEHCFDFVYKTGKPCDHLIYSDIGLIWPVKYYQISNIKHTKSKNWNVSHLILQLSLPNPLKPGAKSIIKM